MFKEFLHQGTPMLKLLNLFGKPEEEKPYHQKVYLATARVQTQIDLVSAKDTGPGPDLTLWNHIRRQNHNILSTEEFTAFVRWANSSDNAKDSFDKAIERVWHGGALREVEEAFATVKASLASTKPAYIMAAMGVELNGEHCPPGVNCRHLERFSLTARTLMGRHKV